MTGKYIIKMTRPKLGGLIELKPLYYCGNGNTSVFMSRAETYDTKSKALFSIRLLGKIYNNYFFEIIEKEK